jgi:hypothetical protein
MFQLVLFWLFIDFQNSVDYRVPSSAPAAEAPWPQNGCVATRWMLHSST